MRPLELLKADLEDEKYELDNKLSSLLRMINSVGYSKLRMKHKDLLKYQFNHMNDYSKVLRNRIIEVEKDIENEEE